MASKPHNDDTYRPKREPKTPIKFHIQLNPEQKEAKQKILDNTITLLAGQAGSGKTLVACNVALDGLFRRQNHNHTSNCIQRRYRFFAR